MKSNCLENKRVLMFQQRNWARRIGHFLAKKLQDHGCVLSAVTLKKTTHEFVLTQNEVEYSSIVSHDDVMEFPEKYLSGKSVSLTQICNELGVDSIWPAVNSLRNHVRNYGKKYYYSFQQNVSDEEIVKYVKAVYIVFSAILDDEKPDLIMAPNFVSLPHVVMCLLAKRRGIPMQAVTDVKVKGRYMFTYSYNDDEGPFFDRLRKLNSGVESQNSDRAIEYLRAMRARFSQPDYFTSKAKNSSDIASAIRDWKGVLLGIYSYYRRGNPNRLTNLGVTGDNKPPRVLLRDQIQKKHYEKSAMSRSYSNLESIGSYAYFPLQFQPEATIDMFAPYFSNQLDAIRQVAMSMPGDMTLVVKDHPSALLYRSDTFLDKVSNTPNVKLIDYRTPADKVLKGASIVISPNSTTLMEAAIFKKPGIQLGNCGTTLVIPSVLKHTDMPSLASAIKSHVENTESSWEYDDELCRYIAAAYDAGWEFNYHGLWERDEPVDMDELWSIYHTEIDSLFNGANDRAYN